MKFYVHLASMISKMVSRIIQITFLPIFGSNLKLRNKIHLTLPQLDSTYDSGKQNERHKTDRRNVQIQLLDLLTTINVNLLPFELFKREKKLNEFSHYCGCINIEI